MIAVVTIVFSLLLLALRVLSMFWTAVTLYGYTLIHQANDLRAEFGFFTRVSATTPLKRAQALTVQEGPLHRLFGRVTVRLQRWRSRQRKGSNAPYVKGWLRLLSRRPPRSSNASSPYPPDDGAWQPAHPRAFRRAVIVPSVLWHALSAADLLRPSWGLVLLAGLLGWAALNAQLTVRSTGWRTTADAVFFKSGWIWRQMTVVRLERIQAVSLRETPFDRRHRWRRSRSTRWARGGRRT